MRKGKTQSGKPRSAKNSAKLPLWYQIANRLRSEILEGQLGPRARIDPETRLAEKYGVSVAPVRQALQVLEQESLIFRMRGSGTFVSDKPPTREIGATSLEELYSTEFTKPARILERCEVETPMKFRSHFVDHASLHAITRLAYREDAPWSFGVLYIPNRYSDTLSTSDLERYPLYRLLAEQHGIQLNRSHFEAKAIAVSELGARYLEIAPYAPALALTCVTFDNNECTIGAFDLTFPNDPFVFGFDTRHRLHSNKF